MALSPEALVSCIQPTEGGSSQRLRLTDMGVGDTNMCFLLSVSRSLVGHARLMLNPPLVLLES